MRFCAAVLIGLLLLTVPSGAWGDDPFESVPVPAPDPFRTAPATPAPKPAPRPEPAPAPAPDPDLIFWTTIEGSSNPSDFETYLRLFSNGRFAEEARARLTALRATLPTGTIIVNSGILTPLASHQNHTKKCRARQLPLAIIEQPQHGTVTVREEAVKVPANQQVGNSCSGALVDGKRIYYQSEAGFKGNDRVTYQYTLADGVARRDTLNIVVR